MQAESNGIVVGSKMRPVLEGSGREPDPCQLQLVGPSVLAKSTNELNALLRQLAAN